MRETEKLIKDILETGRNARMKGEELQAIRLSYYETNLVKNYLMDNGCSITYPLRILGFDVITEYNNIVSVVSKDDEINNEPCEEYYTCNEFSGRSEQSYKDEIAKLKDDADCYKRQYEQQKAFKKDVMNSCNCMYEENRQLRKQVENQRKSIVDLVGRVKEKRSYTSVDLNDIIKYKGFELVVTSMRNGKIETVEELDKMIAKTRVINVGGQWTTMQEYINDCK